jgi:hypothetical protein
MDRPGIGGPGNDSVTGIDLPHEMAFAEPTNRRVTTHRTDGIEIKADERSARTHPCGDSCRLNAGVSAANNNDVKLVHGFGRL